jgi:DNA-binding response OmpR family regulator
MSHTTVLVVEDDEAIRRGVVDSLRFAGYDVLESANGTKGLQLALESTLDLVLLDVLLPGADGFTILDQLRQAHPTLPVIMVTARGAEEDRVRGLSNGADDYVVKPFSARELLARVEAVLRRSPERPDSVRTLIFDGVKIDLERREVISGDGTHQSLSEREAGILRYLAGTRGRAVDRRELLQRVWGLNPRGIETRTVDMHIARLREKLGDESADARIILTVRGKGYRLADGVRTSDP